MDPIEILGLCVAGATSGAPDDIVVPHMFSVGDFEAMWRREPMLVRASLDAILCGPHPDDGLELLLKSGALEALLPEIKEMKGLGDDPAAALHKDVWDHTKKVVCGTPPQLELRWGALMHDVGKARTRKFVNGKVTFHNHDFVGAKMLDTIEHRLDLFRDDSTLFTTVRSLVLNHLRPAGYKKSWSDSGVRRLLTDIGGLRNFERLMHLSRADLTTKNAQKRDRALARGRELEARVAQIYTEDTAPKLPKMTMGLIIERKVMPVGPGLNIVRNGLEAMLRAGELPAGKDASWYANEGLTLLLAKGPISGPGGTVVPC